MSTPGSVAWDRADLRGKWRTHVDRTTVAAVVAFGLTAFTVLLGFLATLSQDAMMRDGETATAVVIKEHPSARTDEVWSVTVRFTVDGRDESARIDVDAFDDHPVGSTIEVVYPRSRPYDAVSADEDDTDWGGFFVIIPVALTLGAWSIVTVNVASARRWRRGMLRSPARSVDLVEVATDDQRRIVRLTTGSDSEIGRVVGVSRVGIVWISALTSDLRGDVTVCELGPTRRLLFTSASPLPLEVAVPRTRRTRQRLDGRFDSDHPSHGAATPGDD